GKTTVERVSKKLLRVEMRPDKITLGENTIQLPTQVAWLDDALAPVRYQYEFPGMGKITLYETTREIATTPNLAPDQLPDLALNTVIYVSKAIDGPYATKQAVYRITVKDDDDPTTIFSRDGRQVPRNAKGGTFELVVKAQSEPGKEV